MILEPISRCRSGDGCPVAQLDSKALGGGGRQVGRRMAARDARVPRRTPMSSPLPAIQPLPVLTRGRRHRERSTTNVVGSANGQAAGTRAGLLGPRGRGGGCRPRHRHHPRWEKETQLVSQGDVTRGSCGRRHLPPSAKLGLLLHASAVDSPPATPVVVATAATIDEVLC